MIQAYPDRPMTIEGLDSPTYPYRNYDLHYLTDEDSAAKT